MGLLYSEAATPEQSETRELATLHELECKACPLNPNIKGKIEPTGSSNPDIYILGEAPGATEEKERAQFVGETGQLLRSHLPKKHLSRIRWNNVIRTRPTTVRGANRAPEFPEIEACRPSIIRDIEATKPRAILGFGNVPLQWVSGGFSQITLWRGRRMPVRIGNHSCWYYPITHPSFIQRARRSRDKDVSKRGFIGSEDERMFAFDIRRAFDEILGSHPIPDADPHTPKRALEGVEFVEEFGAAGVLKVQRGLERLLNEPVVGVDYETNMHRPYSKAAKILTIGVGSPDFGFAFPLDHRESKWSPAERKKVVGLWIDFLMETKAVKAVHNLSFDLEWTVVKFGAKLLRAGRWEDTQTQAAILDERRGKVKPGAFSLEFLVQQYFGFNLKKISGVNRKNLDNIPLPAVLRYNALDGKYHANLWIAQDDRIVEEDLVEPYVLGLRRVPTVVAAQVVGVPVDQGVVDELFDRYTDRIADIEAELKQDEDYKLFKRKTGHALNPSSNPDVGRLFHQILKYKEVWIVDKKTHDKRLSVDESVLSAIVKNHDNNLARLLLLLRKANKRLSTYIDPMDINSENTVVHEDGLLHPIFNTTFAETGRLSCEDPNMQNFPKREEEAREVRRPIAAPRGHTILAFDYGQIEARVIAMFTKDKRFCKALWENYDVHMEWAERIASVYPQRVGGERMLKDKGAMKKFRTDIKNQWTFPLFFGAQLSSAANYLTIPEEVLAPLYEEFWDQFSGVKTWQEEQLAFYREHGYVACLTGRRRRGPMSTNKVFNSPIQGTAAEIVMDAMCRLSETGDPELQPEINIHDDLTFVRIREDRSEVVAEKIIDMMLDVPFKWVNVPITVELSAGPNWEDMEEIGTFSSAD